jgi:hypothetical protein
MATKANVTEFQRSEIPLVYQIQRTKGSAPAELKKFGDTPTRKPKTPVQQFMDMVFTGSPTFNPVVSSAQAFTFPVPGAASSWRLITPPYEDAFATSTQNNNSSVVASAESGQLSTYETSTDQQIAELVVSLSSPTQTKVSISPVGTYVAGINFLKAVEAVDAEVLVQLIAFQDRTYVDGHGVIPLARRGSYASGYRLYSGNIADLEDPDYGALCPLSFTMEPNAKYHVVLKITSSLTCDPHSVVMTAGAAVPYFFLKTFS